ncbi:hypothetical protein FACS1894161_5250 [Spirochaetia bacterium]|nr:hypothetical protein FACS1894161_5250 [Spirochaetia bacterium]
MKQDNKAGGYDMPGHVVDGNDVMEILDVFSECKERVLAGEGPSLIEAKTYR